ncbi:MAG: tetratricopeptide repeat protein [Paracoccaceae bacterium]|nr:tetratricopeptide repeat protein [Paracoccaceae bacterium]
MRAKAVIWLAAGAMAISLGACESVSNTPDPLAGSVIDEANLNELMLTAGDPEDAVRYFQESSAREPDRADFRRGLALSLARTKRYHESARVYQELITLGQDEPSDRLEYAFVAMRLDRWDDVRALSESFPDGLQTPRRYVIDAMVADQDNDWATADAAYAKAERMSSRPAAVLNNWGVSQMSRGDLSAASTTFNRAISYDSSLFNAKNNLAIVRGLQGEYSLPLVPLKDAEKAVLLNNLGIIAMRQGEEQVARGLFAAAVDAHPEHYPAAADKLAALDAGLQ